MYEVTIYIIFDFKLFLNCTRYVKFKLCITLFLLGFLYFFLKNTYKNINLLSQKLLHVILYNMIVCFKLLRIYKNRLGICQILHYKCKCVLHNIFFKFKMKIVWFVDIEKFIYFFHTSSQAL